MNQTGIQPTELPWETIEDLPESSDDEYAHLFDIGKAKKAAKQGKPIKAYCGIVKIPNLTTSKPKCPKCQDIESTLNIHSRWSL